MPAGSEGDREADDGRTSSFGTRLAHREGAGSDRADARGDRTGSADAADRKAGGIELAEADRHHAIEVGRSGSDGLVIKIDDVRSIIVSIQYSFGESCVENHRRIDEAPERG